ncbi:cysteine dioxygenase [Streptomyces halobius]|uniref:Cysteine dioxygenase family protein n=1 Tax=Streptomyces halobius TaxID=2879846 RepID=A0ABY4MBD2_9ACTN|nr:cysteine dioxygenase family protein [Streptomyces halobius]UQA95052.1 cysteine dioxygenase family protein [Streptomyces halobius]
MSERAQPFAELTDVTAGARAATGVLAATDAAAPAPADPFRALPERNLDKRELQALVDELAARPCLWREDVAFSDTERHYASLHRDEHVDVWLLCWTRRNDTGWHDHDISSGAVRVVQGVLTESNPRIGGEHPATAVGAGSSFCFGPDHIHRLTGATDDAISVHAYSPPLWRLGQYDITEDGLMRRVSVSYADELRPLDAPAGLTTRGSTRRSDHPGKQQRKQGEEGEGSRHTGARTTVGSGG